MGPPSSQVLGARADCALARRAAEGKRRQDTRGVQDITTATTFTTTFTTICHCIDFDRKPAAIIPRHHRHHHIQHVHDRTAMTTRAHPIANAPTNALVTASVGALVVGCVRGAPDLVVVCRVQDVAVVARQRWSDDACIARDALGDHSLAATAA